MRTKSVGEVGWRWRLRRDNLPGSGVMDARVLIGRLAREHNTLFPFYRVHLWAHALCSMQLSLYPLYCELYIIVDLDLKLDTVIE